MQHRLILTSFHALSFLALLSVEAPAQAEVWTQAQLEEVTRSIEQHVAELRGHPFTRATEVRIADKQGFLAYVLERNKKHHSKEEQEADQALARHLGLIPAKMDLMQVTLDLLEQQVGGFYSPGEDTFYLMDSFTGGLAKVILAHELTHALDDQLYDLDAPLMARKGSSDAMLAYSSVIEGSGTNVMNRWTLRHRDLWTREELLASASMGSAGLSDAPPYMWKPLMAAYLKGEAFLLAGYKALKKSRAKGAPRPSVNEAIDQAFASPPLSMEQVLHPEKYWSPQERDDPSDVTHELGELTDGWRLSGRDTLGELSLALVLTPQAEKKGLDLSNPMAALTIRYSSPAAAGWDGDEVVLLTRAGASVLHIATAWDSAQEALEFKSAIRPLLAELETRQVEMVGAGAESGWLINSYSDERLVSIALWAGCARTEIDALEAGPLSWSVDWK